MFIRIAATAAAVASLGAAVGTPATLAMQGVAPSSSRRAAPPDVPQSEYAARRARLAERMADGAVLVAQGAPEPHQDYNAFVQSSSFLYLTGLREPDAALVMVKRAGRVSAMLFVPRGTPETEVWSGRRLGPEATQRETGITARPNGELRAALDSLLAIVPRLALVPTRYENGYVAEHDRTLAAALRERFPRLAVDDLGEAVQSLRGRKSDAELALIRRAVDITVDALRDAMRVVEPRMNEFEAQAMIEYNFRRYGAERPAFASIVGSGPNTTTLHYNANDRFMTPVDLLVMDVGASYRGYAADVTRTIPVNGTFTPDQRAVYQLVRDAQAAAEREAKPGADAQRLSDAAASVLAIGLTRLGLVESPNATYDCDAQGVRQCPQLALYYMHGLGHGIGLDVHDPDQYYETGRLGPGSAFTLEPGIYVRANLLDVIPDTPRNKQLETRIGAAVRRFANIGVRIEDDYVVTAAGVEWISKAPREADEIEALMREPSTGPGPRDERKVEWYRGAP